MTMQITALAPWFGSKRTLAPRIASELGPHRVYWEPFCGSMAVLLAKPPCVMETVNDLHDDLINLANVIQHPQAGPRLYRRLRRVLMSEHHFDQCGERIREHKPPKCLDEYRAFDYFITSWLGRNGVVGTSSYNAHFCVRYTANGGHAAKRWDSALRSIPQWRRRLANVTILHRDAFELLPRIDDKAGTAIYVDPPYITKGATYQHDFGMQSKRSQDAAAAIDDHRRLAIELQRFKHSRVVVSYYEHPMLAELYPGWTKVECPTTKSLVSQGKRDKLNTTIAPEVLLINGPSLTAPAGDGGLFEGGAA